jgi:hypothetical protein
VIGVTAAGGPLGWMAAPFLQHTAPRFPGVEWTVINDFEHRSNFSRRLMEVLRGMDDAVLLWSCVDMYLDRDVEPGALESLARYVEQKGNVVRMGLDEGSWPQKHVCFWEGREIVRCADVSHCSIMAGTSFDLALFHRENLLRLLQPGWTVQDVEVWGTEKVLTDPGLESVAVRPGLFRKVEVHCHQGWFWHLDRLSPEEQRSLRDAAPTRTEWRS